MIIFALMIALGYSLNAFAASNNCEKNLQVPEWAARSIEETTNVYQRAMPKENGVHNTFPAKINGKDLVLHYVKYKSSEIPSKGTVVYQCGGPGVACNRSGRPKNIPQSYDVLVMDYLGIGENNEFNSPEQMSIQSQGSAITQMVKYLKPPNVVLMGHSFGTTVATVAASQLTSSDDSDSMTLIKGVLIEGVVGKGDYKNYEKSFARAADTVWELLSETEKQNFKKSYLDITKKLNPEETQTFNRFLTGQVSAGSLEAAKALKEVKSDTNIDALKRRLAILSAFNTQLANGDSLQQLRAAACQIMSASTDGKEQKVFGGVVTVTTPVPKGLCDCKTLAKMWDPAQYQIKGIPVLYVNGAQDPNTAIEWAQSHYDGQTQVADKVMISRKYGGHMETYGSLKTCIDTFYDALVSQDLSKIKTQRSDIEKSGCQQNVGSSSQKQNTNFKGIQ